MVALAIPLTLAIVFSVMEITGIDLQRISLGALIIALALLVDDAMTTVDAMIAASRRATARTKAATFAYSTLAAPMLAGTLVTIAGFVPIGFAKSSAGEYTFSIFAVVGIALIVSWFVAVHFRAGDRHGDPEAAQGRCRRGQAEQACSRLTARFLHVRNERQLADDRGDGRNLRRVDLCCCASCRSQFFPASDRPELARRPDAAAERVDLRHRGPGQRLEEVLKDDPDVDHWSTYVGRGAIRFYLPLNVQLPNPFFAQR